MRRGGWNAGLLFALVLAGALSPWASSTPDGLERVAQRLGFARRAAATPAPAAPMAEYRVPAVPNERASTAVAGLAGTLVVFGVAGGLGYALRRKGSTAGAAALGSWLLALGSMQSKAASRSASIPAKSQEPRAESGSEERAT
jgi:cobalt/nickel transport protein